MDDKMNQGYIYIYKCVVGSGSDICKIGITQNFHDRLKQHVRTPYYGFMPYIEFTTGNPIATVFKVNDCNKSDKIIKNEFSKYQFSNIEIYNVDYDKAIEEIYNILKKERQLIELIKENYSEYNFLDNKNKIDKTTKKEFLDVKERIVSKYGNNFPEELVIMLREKNDFKENCKSHFNTGNFIKFNNDMILDLNYNKSIRVEILNKLKRFL